MAEPPQPPPPTESITMFGIDVSGGQLAGELDCGDFQYREDARDLWNQQGWTATNDPYNLDGGGTTIHDGDPCEDLPARP